MNDIQNNVRQGQGLYQQLIDVNRVPYTELTYEKVKEVFEELFYKQRDNSNKDFKIWGYSETFDSYQDLIDPIEISDQDYHYPF